LKSLASYQLPLHFQPTAVVTHASQVRRNRLISSMCKAIEVAGIYLSQYLFSHNYSRSFLPQLN